MRRVLCFLLGHVPVGRIVGRTVYRQGIEAVCLRCEKPL